MGILVHAQTVYQALLSTHEREPGFEAMSLKSMCLKSMCLYIGPYVQLTSRVYSIATWSWS